MSSAVVHPLVLVGIGRAGARVVTELSDTAEAIAAPERSPHAVVTIHDDSARRIHARFTAAAGPLLEAGAGGEGGRVRLDIVVVADTEGLEPAQLIVPLRAITAALQAEYPVLFPTDTAVDQRSVWLTMFLGTVPLVGTRDGRSFADLLAAVDAFAADAPHPALSRVFLQPRQTTAGRLDQEGLEEALRAGVQSLFLSGSRDEDQIRAVLAHRSDGRRYASLSVATAELPIAKIRRYARWRLALSALEILREQAESPTTDPARARALLERLDGGALLEGFSKGEAAERVRGRAARLSGAEDHLPKKWRVGITERPLELRTRYRVLFDAIAKPWTRRTDPTTDPDHEAMLRKVDQAEAIALAEADRRLVALLDEELDPTTALRVLPPLEHALKQARHDLEEELAADVPVLPSPEPPPPPDDPGLRELERVIDGRPGIRRTYRVLLALTAATGAVTMLLVSWAMAPEVAVAAASSNDFPPTTTEAWAAGLLAGILTALAWQLIVLWMWRHKAERALERRTHELDSAWRRGGAGQEREQAEQLLAVRRRRTARDLARRFDHAIERLAAMRAAIRQTTVHASDALVDLRVRLGPSPRQDDLSGLLGTETSLHRALVEPGALASRLDALTSQRDVQHWASLVLSATWPRVGGLSEDLPCLDVDTLLKTCDDQLGTLSARGLLEDQHDTSADRSRQFVADGVEAIGWGIRPLDEHGDPVRGEGRDRRILLAPTSMRSAVDRSIADASMSLEPCWTRSEVPWLSVFAVWDGLTRDQIVRGMGGEP